MGNLVGELFNNNALLGCLASIPHFKDDLVDGGYNVYDITPFGTHFDLPAVKYGNYLNATTVDIANLNNMVLTEGDAIYLKVKAYEKLNQTNKITDGSDSSGLPAYNPPSNTVPARYLELSIQSPSWENLGYRYIDADTKTSLWTWTAKKDTTIGRLAIRERLGPSKIMVKSIYYYRLDTSDGFARFKKYKITPKARFFELPTMTQVDIVDIRNLNNAPSDIAFDASGLKVRSGDGISVEVVEMPTTYNEVDPLKATGEIVEELPSVIEEPYNDLEYYMDASIQSPIWTNFGYQHINPETMTYEFLWVAPVTTKAGRIGIRERINQLGVDVVIEEFKCYITRSYRPRGLSAWTTGTLMPTQTSEVGASVCHGLGIVPDFFFWVVEDDLTKGDTKNICTSGALIRKPEKYSNGTSRDVTYFYSGMTESGGWGAAVNKIKDTSYNYMTNSDCKIFSDYRYKLQPGYTYRWVCGVLDGIE
jgi:hypothetical protein